MRADEAALAGTLGERVTALEKVVAVLAADLAARKREAEEDALGWNDHCDTIVAMTADLPRYLP